jgi:AbrB family looped-hinge helix DNA binding protein
MASKVGSKGQVVIEKKLRERLGVEPGHFAVQRIVGDHVEIRFHPPEHDRSLRAALADAARRSVSPDEWRELKERAWFEASASNQEQGS